MKKSSSIILMSAFMFTILLFLFPSDILSHDVGNLKIRLKNFPLYLGESSEVEVEGSNPHPYSTDDGKFKLQIRYKMSDELVFEHEWTDVEIEENSNPKVSTYPELFTPDKIGLYKLYAEYSSPEDINPNNNTTELEINVEESPVEIKMYDFTFYRMDLYEPFYQMKSKSGLLNIKYFGKEYSSFLNILASTDTLGEPVWLLRNAIIPAYEDSIEFGIWIDYGRLGINNGDPLDSLRIYYFDSTHTRTRIPTFTWDSTTTNHKIFDMDYHLSNGVLDSLPPRYINFDFDSTIESSPIVDEKFYGCTIPNIDLNSTLYNPETVDGYAGDDGACAPAAAANSMQWLEDCHDDINTGQNHREKLVELSDMMDRENGRGVWIKKFIEAKLEYINEHKLPIRVKFQVEGLNEDVSSTDEYESSARNEGDGSYPLYSYIAHELKDSEDVEIFVELHEEIDGVDSLVGRHVAVLSGYSHGARGTHRIWVKDDGDGDSNGGTAQTSMNWTVNEDGVPVLTADGNAWGDIWIVPYGVVSESRDPTVKFQEKSTLQRVGDFFGGLYRWAAGDDPVELADKRPNLYNVAVRKDESSQPEWLIRNFPYINSANGPVTDTWGDLSRIGIGIDDPVESIQAAVFIGEDVWTDMPAVPDEEWFNYPLSDLEHKVENGSLDDDSPVLSGPFDIPTPLPFSGTTLNIRDDYMTGMEAKNIDLEADLNTPVILQPYAGDNAASGPAAASNILQWLEEKHDEISTGLNHREKLVSLSHAMNRNDKAGVGREDMIKGCLGFIDENMLPVSVKFQSMRLGTEDIAAPDDRWKHSAENENSEANKSPQLDWLKSQIMGNDLLVMELAWYSETGRIRGHWTSLCGSMKLNDVDRLYIKDDIRQDTEGGLRHSMLTWDETDEGLAFIPEFSSDGIRCFVESIVSISFDPTVVYNSVTDNAGKSSFVSAYPNPMESGKSMNIEYTIPQPGPASLEVYNMFGNRLITLDDKEYDSGTYNLTWDAKTVGGIEIPGGVYFIVLKGNSFRETVKLIIH